jgi:glycosyltransferase involved in cell wall biosynthesis
VKIAVLSHLKFPISPPFAGGLERHTHATVAGLQARGHDVTLFAAEGSDPALRPVEMCPPTGPHTGDAAHDTIIDAAEHAAYTRMMAAVAKGGFDVVHVNCLHGLPLLESRRIAAPTVVVLHVPRFEPFATALDRARPHVAVVAVSRQLAKLWDDGRSAIEVIGNGVDLAAFAPAPPDEIGPNAFWSGRIGPEKGLHLAIDAARMAGLELAFAGPRTDEDYWQAEIAPRLGPDLRDLGHLGEAALAGHLSRSRVAVISPCWEEPFGLVVVEALACGTPVAAFARGAIPDLVDEATGRLAAPDGVAELARAIREASALDRDACRARAEARFGIDIMLDRYEALYRRVVAAPLVAAG